MASSYHAFIALSSIILLPQLTLNAQPINSYTHQERTQFYIDIPETLERTLNMHSLPSVKRDRIHNQLFDFIGIEIRKSKINFLYPEKKAAIESKNVRHLYKSIMNEQIDDFKNSSNLLKHNSLIID